VGGAALHGGSAPPTPNITSVLLQNLTHTTRRSPIGWSERLEADIRNGFLHIKPIALGRGGVADQCARGARGAPLLNSSFGVQQSLLFLRHSLYRFET
jgi:hypothetical protein